MKVFVNIDAIKAVINELFTELIPFEPTEEDKQKAKHYLGIEDMKAFAPWPVNTRDQESLKNLAENKLAEYLKENEDNSIDLFISVETKKAVEWQSYFHQYETDSEHKKYYFILQRWIAVLASMHSKVAKNAMKTTLNENQLSTLYKLLKAGKYIKGTKENDFIIVLSNMTSHGALRINWVKSKKMAVNLLDKICYNFSFPTVNNCIKTEYKEIDSNDRPKRDYNEINTLVNKSRDCKLATS